MSHSAKAVDIVVLPPDTLRPDLDRLNGQLAAPPDGFRFDASHLPHVTLVQLFVQDHLVNRLRSEVAEVLRGVPPIVLRTGDISHGRSTSAWQLDRSEALTTLHERLMKRVAPFETGVASATAFVDDGETPRDADVTWVDRYRADASFAHFDPHVTLGVGQMTCAPKPTTVVATEIAVCQLGRYCTCRRVLAGWSLAGAQ